MQQRTHQPETPEPTSSGKFHFSKWVTFWLMYLGYTLAVLNRKSFTFALPAIMKERELNKDELGLITSSQNLAYTGSKFLGGIVSDMVSPKLLFGAGLCASGLCTIGFTTLESVSGYAALWFLHGLVQGGQWPACAKMLKHWFNPTVFGTAWGGLSSSMNIACTAGPLLMIWLVTYTRWTSTFWIYGFSAIVVAALCLLFMVDSPTDIGHESFAERKNDDKGRGGKKGRGTWQDMVHAPFMWVCCISYLVIFWARTATLDWGQLYLIQECHQSEYMGSLFVSVFETGGVLGSIVAGYVADKVVTMSVREDTRGTPRMTVCMVFILIFIVSIHAMLFMIDKDSSQVWITFLAFIQGFAVYGPISLYGIMAIEAAPSHLSGTSHAIVSLSANIGAILAGLPFSFTAKYFNWGGAFFLLEVLVIAVLIMKVLTRNVEYKMVTIKKKLQ